jgi:hypothetical protein
VQSIGEDDPDVQDAEEGIFDRETTEEDYEALSADEKKKMWKDFLKEAK